MFQKQITKEEIYELPLKAFEGEVVVVEDKETLKEVLPELRRQAVLGFDTETKPNFKKGIKNNNRVALLQLASAEKAYLFRLNKLGFPGILKDLMADDTIIKIGAAIKEDIKCLQEIKDFEPAGFVELQNYVKGFGIESSSVKKLTAIVLNFRISKNQQLSNWENGKLTPAQMRYAATDAWVCHQIYSSLLVLEN
jgi:ribonuclease D